MTKTRETYPPSINYVWLILLVVVIVLALSGCGVVSHHSRPEPIRVLVPVKCSTTKPVTPVYPNAAADDGIYDRVKDLLAEREMRIAYEGQLEAANQACA